jgi:adenylate cyclase
MRGRESGRDFRLGQRTTIGSDSMQCDVILSDRTVSGKHARVQREGKTFVLYDLASKNGTFLNGQRVQKMTLNDDDEIRLGQTVLVFKVTPVK